MKPSQEQLDKLPKWAQSHIGDLENARSQMERCLNEFVDDQTPDKFFYEDHPYNGNSGMNTKRRYVHTHRISCEHLGIHVEILAFENRLEISYGTLNHAMNEVAMIPSSYQQVRLVAKENMR